MSIPIHFCEWDVRRAATLRVLIWLWEFADRELDDEWCFQTDEQVVDGCKLRDRRHLRECLRDLRDAEIVFRETGPCGRPGFHLHNRAPFTGEKPPAEVRRRKSAAQTAEVRRPNGGSPPPHLLESRRAEEQSKTQLLDPTREERWSIELEAELVRLQNLANQDTAGRLGRACPGRIVPTPGIRHAIEARMLEGYTADQLRKAMETRRRVGGERDFQFLGGASAWSSKAIEFALGIPDDEKAQCVPVADADGFIPEY